MVFDLSPLQCVGIRKDWLSGSSSKSRSCDGWGATIQVPELPCSAKHRRSLGGMEEKYTDGHVEIDRTGLRFLKSKQDGVQEVSSEWAKMLEAARRKGDSSQVMMHDDDMLSVASTHVEEELQHAPARARLASSGSVRSDVTQEEVAWLRKVNARVVSTEEKKAQFESSKQTKHSVKYENIVKIAKIGKGSSGNVWRCMDTATREPLAVKEVPVDDDDEKTQMAVRELVTLYGVDHAGVVTCHEVFFSRGSFHIVMEMMDGGSLLDAMRRARDGYGYCGLGAQALAAVGISVLQALEFLHVDLEVVHRDVKPGNILLTSNGQVKLADLGICTHPGSVQEGSEAEELAGRDGRATPATEWIGTVTYMSPERLIGDGYGFNADIWSLGIVLVEAAVGGYPLAPTQNGTPLQFWDLLDRVLSGPCPSDALKDKGEQWAQLRSFAAMCLDKDPETRPMARDIKTHPFLAKADPYHLAMWVRKFMHGSLEDATLRGSNGWA
mmetsp:Transcript_9021/g.14259  ORF Transcript_9021/g.14259 Transcript_9021/m.14259 type:complete len:496 (+) Transcript_9021:83-1570(+)|eukprot:CAMPEP_0184326602 /NCGR_PEP_ID=MMETSP1049-20130417/142646_1 /TAXON_ID=77928 /ORGANISM="Proteomonas sulcata, Strain CCMP704" /LENGTH=495 /DNA_ID=CAMNT_0026648805 /DNA_START=1118 /DNA_END=2605 /DNA_ORIENTATION=+